MKVVLLMIFLFLNRLKGWRRSRLGWLCAFSLSLAHLSVICQYFHSYWENVLKHILLRLFRRLLILSGISIFLLSEKNPSLLLQSMRASFCRWRWEFPRVRWWVPIKMHFSKIYWSYKFFYYGLDKHWSYKSQLPLKKQSPPQIQHSDSQVCVSDIQTVRSGSCPYFSLLPVKDVPLYRLCSFFYIVQNAFEA